MANGINWASVSEQDFDISETHDSAKEIREKAKKLIVEAVQNLLPKSKKEKFGILFSGGLDSTLIALICKKAGFDPICYTSALDEPGMETAQDVIHSEKAAKQLGLKLKIVKLKLNQVEERIKTIAPLIEDNTVVKIGVGLTMFAALEAAKKDGVKTVFSGLGAEEIFAGYERHKLSSNINRECLSGLLNIYERDLKRDIAITDYFKIRPLLPFLDEKLVRYALTIPGRCKVVGQESKVIEREIAKELGMKKEFAERKKQAAQYGSKFAKAIEKLAKKAGASSQAEYLSQFYTRPDSKMAALVSSGKDSLFAAYLMKVHNYKIECFVTLKSKNQDSYMFHTPAIEMVKLQAEAAQIPLIYDETEGKKEDELVDLKRALSKAKEKYGVKGVVSGALFSNYQKERVDKVCESLGLHSFAPTWHEDQELHMRHVLKNGFHIIFTAIAAEGLDKTWLGREITLKDIEKLKELNKKYGVNIAGEGGEFESLVLDCPLFKKKLHILESEIKEESKHVARMIIKKAELVEK